MLYIWHHTFYNVLEIAPEEQPVLLTEAPQPTSKQRKNDRGMGNFFLILPDSCVHEAKQMLSRFIKQMHTPLLQIMFETLWPCRLCCLCMQLAEPLILC
jgi:hypothetical protein